jgi:hypothetical protein
MRKSVNLSLAEFDAAGRAVPFGDGMIVNVRASDAILTEQATAEAARNLATLKSGIEAAEALGVDGADMQDMLVKSPLGVARWLQAVAIARAYFIGWTGNLPTSGGPVDLANVDLTPQNIAVFVRDPGRMQRVMALPYEAAGALQIEGEPLPADSNGS